MPDAWWFDHPRQRKNIRPKQLQELSSRGAFLSGRMIANGMRTSGDPWEAMHGVAMNMTMANATWATRTHRTSGPGANAISATGRAKQSTHPATNSGASLQGVVGDSDWAAVIPIGRGDRLHPGRLCNDERPLVHGRRQGWRGSIEGHVDHGILQAV